MESREPWLYGVVAMTVYVDSMRAGFGRMIMCHMVADTDEELHAMAATIGVARRWHQKPPKASSSHYDIALTKRALAVKAGAVEIEWRQTAAMCFRRRFTGSLGDPADAIEWMLNWKRERDAKKEEKRA